MHISESYRAKVTCAGTSAATDTATTCSFIEFHACGLTARETASAPRLHWKYAICWPAQERQLLTTARRGCCSTALRLFVFRHVASVPRLAQRTPIYVGIKDGNEVLTAS